MLLVVILAIAAVVIAKQRAENQRNATPAASLQQAPLSAGEAASGEAVERPLTGSALSEALGNGRPTMADFGKGWCQPCKEMVPVLDQAAKDYRGKANIIYVDLEQYPDLGHLYRISAMPTQVFFNANGAEAARHIGYMDTAQIEQQLAALGAKR